MFPRGRRSSGPKDAKASGKPHQKRSSSRPRHSRDSKPKQTAALPRSRLSTGMTLLGSVASISSRGLSVSLPFGHRGFVPSSEVGNTIVLERQRLQGAGQQAGLSRWFKPGQLVRCAVLHTGSAADQAAAMGLPAFAAQALAKASESKGSQQQVVLSLRPAAVAWDVPKGQVIPGAVVGGEVVSEEDHGWMVDIGIDGLHGFLVKNKSDGTDCQRDLRAALGDSGAAEEGDSDSSDSDEDEGDEEATGGEEADGGSSAEEGSSDDDEGSSDEEVAAGGAAKASAPARGQPLMPGSHIVAARVIGVDQATGTVRLSARSPAQGAAPSAARWAGASAAGLRPGTPLRCRVLAHTGAGVVVSTLSKALTGTIATQHLPGPALGTWRNDPSLAIGKTVHAVVIAVDHRAATPLLALSALPHHALLARPAPLVTRGERPPPGVVPGAPASLVRGLVLQDCTVLRVDPSAGVLLAWGGGLSGAAPEEEEEEEEERAAKAAAQLAQLSDAALRRRLAAALASSKGICFAPTSALAQGKLDRHTVVKRFRLGRVLRARVTGEQLSEDCLVVSLDPKVVSAPVMRLEDLKPGQVVQGEVVGKPAPGKAIQLGIAAAGTKKPLVGIISPIHHSDNGPITRQGRLPKAGSKLRAMVLQVEGTTRPGAKAGGRTRQRRALLTLRPALLSSQLPRLSSGLEAAELLRACEEGFDEVRPLVAHAFVSAVDGKGLSVTFLGRLWGRVHVGDLGPAYAALAQGPVAVAADRLREEFPLGMVLRVRVRAVNPKTGRLSLTAASAEMAGAPDAAEVAEAASKVASGAGTKRASRPADDGDAAAGSTKRQRRELPPVGSVVPVEVQGWIGGAGRKGLRVQLASGARGVVDITHIADRAEWQSAAGAGLGLGESLAAGASAEAVVLGAQPRADGEGATLMLSLRPSLLRAAKRHAGGVSVAAIRSAELQERSACCEAAEEGKEAEKDGKRRGPVTLGVVTASTPRGVFVKLSMSLEGRCKLRDLSDSFIKDVTDKFPPGKVVACRVLGEVKPPADEDQSQLPATAKCAVTLRPSQVTGERRKRRPEGDNSRCSVQAGDVVSGEVVGVAPFGVFVRLAAPAGAEPGSLGPKSLCHASNLPGARRLKVARKAAQEAARQRAAEGKPAEEKEEDEELTALRKRLLARFSVGDDVTCVVTKVAQTDGPKSQWRVNISLNPKDVQRAKKEAEAAGDDDEQEAGSDDELPADAAAAAGAGADESDGESDGEEESSDDEDAEGSDDDALIAAAGLAGSDDEPMAESDGGEASDDDDDEASDNESESGDEEEEEEEEDEELLGVTVKRSTAGAAAGAEGGEDASSSDGSDDSDSDSDDEEEEEEQATAAGKRRRAEKATSSRQLVERMERDVAAEPHKAVSWVRYMAGLLSLQEVEPARVVAQRGLKRMARRSGLESERLDVWTALLNLEANYGSSASLADAYQQALRVNDPLAVHLRMVTLYERRGQAEEAEELLGVVLKDKRFRRTLELWQRFVELQMRRGDAEAAAASCKRAKLSLSKADGASLEVRLAVLEYKHGSAERGRSMLESMLAAKPKKLDLWRVLADQEEAAGALQQARGVYRRMCTLGLSSKKMRGVFKLAVDFEKRHGSADEVAEVTQMARDYVQRQLQKGGAAGDDE